jgi:hypothetical protein
MGGVGHKLTAYHWRYNRHHAATKLGGCSCGWHARFMRPSLLQRLRTTCCALTVGHDWGDPDPIHTGPVGFEESEDTLIGHVVQCESCGKCK